MNFVRTSTLVLAFAVAPPAAQAGSVDLLPAAAGDHVPARLVAAKQARGLDLDRQPASFAWALDPAQPIERSKPFEAESREYWKRVGAAELDAGVVIHASAPGAVLRLSPVAGATKRAFDTTALEIRYAGHGVPARDAIEQLADAGQLKRAGLDFPEHTVAFRLRPELGAGDFELALPQAGGDVLLHVFEPQSSERLSLAADRSVVLHGGELVLSARFDSQQQRQLGELVGTIASPSGRLFDVRFDPQADGSWQAKARIDAAAGVGEGLWEVHATGFTRDGSVQRDVRTAFDAVVPGARLAARADLARGKSGGLRISLPIEVAAASRYNVSGLLYGSDSTGAMRPFAIAHAAAWAEPGARSIALQFDAELFAKAQGLQAPYELRQLELTDFATQGVIERRERALRFSAD